MHNIVAKFGADVDIGDTQTLRSIKESTTIPVPDVISDWSNDGMC